MTKYVEVTMVDKFTPDKDNIEVGKKYEVVEERGGGVYVYANEKEPKYFLYNDQFKEVEEEEQMKYTQSDLILGTKLRCTKARPSWWTVGKLYNVSLNDDGILQITDDNGHCAYPDYMLDCLNGNHNPVSFEIVEEEKEMTNYVEVTKLMEFTPDEEVIEIGKKYKVLYPTLSGVYIYASKAQPKYFIYNNQFKYSFESNKEEKEMKYELVEKEEAPTLKANVTVDVKEVIQAKVDELRNEAEHLFKKRDRLEQHGINLNKKAQKLKEVIETIKEFE